MFFFVAGWAQCLPVASRPVPTLRLRLNVMPLLLIWRRGLSLFVLGRPHITTTILAFISVSCIDLSLRGRAKILALNKPTVRTRFVPGVIALALLLTSAS